MVICLERVADLHMAQLIPLPLTFSCFSKSRLVFPFWCWLTQVVLDKGPLNVCVCVCVRACVRACVHACVRACVCARALSLSLSLSLRVRACVWLLGVRVGKWPVSRLRA